MSTAREDLLSPDELRKKLYQTFRSKGVLDTLKTQLRNQLIQELKHPLLSGGEPVPGPVSSRSNSLLVTAANTVVADYLKTSGYEYTLSVFYPESSMRKDKIMSTKDMLQFMKISHHSPLYTSLTSSEGEAETGFLTSLLTHLADHRHHKLHSDADTQTTSAGSYRESLVDKMKMIDQEYESLHPRGDKWMSYESKLAAYKRELETQMQAEMKVKMQHFKDVELAKVMMEEKAKSHKEFANFRQDLEKTYEMKASALMNREKHAIDRLQKQQEIDENNVYMQRQTLLKDIEKVRNRENDLKLRMEGFEKTCGIHTDKVKAMEDLLRRRELAVKTSEDTYEQKLHSEVSRYKLELKEEFIKRTEQLTENENRNKVETARIQKDSAALDAETEEHLKACAELRRVQVALEASEQRASLLGQQTELLRDRLEAVSDYSGLKREKVELQGELRLLKRQLEEAKEENRLLRADAGRPTEVQLALQAELQRLQGARRLEQEEFDSQRQVLQAQLQGEAERSAQLRARLTESEERSRWLNSHAEELKTQLRHTQHALENEVLRNPKPSLVDRSVLELSADMLVPPDIYVQRPRWSGLLPGRYDDAGGGAGGVCDAGGPLRGRALPRWAPSVSPEPEETDLLAGAKDRIRELEREAEALEEAYRSYQQRALRSPVSHLLPAARPYSPPPGALGRRPPRRSPPASPRKSRVSGTPRSPPPQRPRVSRHPRTPSPDLAAMYPRPRTPSPDLGAMYLRPRTPSPDLAAMSPRPRTASADQTQRRPSGPARDADLQSSADPSWITQSGGPRAVALSPSRRLSSTPLSPSRKSRPAEHPEEVIVFPQLSPNGGISTQGGVSPEGGLSPAPHRDQTPPGGDFSPDLSPPHAPQLQSTARDRSSPHRMFSSSESSPQPEEIHLEDLSSTLPEPRSIPELLLDTAAPLPREAPAGAPRDPPETPLWLTAPRDPAETPRDPPETLLPRPAAPQDPPETPRDPAETPLPRRGQADEEDSEEQQWERERKERRERRQREQEEAKEREQEELSRLERETTLLEVENAERRDGEKEEEEAVGGKDEPGEEEEEAGCGARSPGEDPLQTYMKVLEATGGQRAQSPVRAEPASPGGLSEERDDSIAAYSHEAVDDDFW